MVAACCTSSSANRLALTVEMYLFQSKRPVVLLRGWLMGAMMIYGGGVCTTTGELLVMVIGCDADGDGCTPT